MTLRLATTDDIPKIVGLQEKAEYLPWLGFAGSADLEKMIRDDDYELLIWQGPLFGFGFLQGLTRPDKVVELGRAAVDVAGRGIGSELIRALVIRAFETHEATRLWLDVAKDNHRARRAYETAGFVEEGTLRQHWLRRTGDRVDLVVYGMLRIEFDDRRAAKRND